MNPDSKSEVIHVAQSVGEQFMQRFNDFIDAVRGGLGDFLWNLFAVIIILMLAKVAMSLVSRATGSVMKQERYHKDISQGKRVDTIMTLVRSVCRYGIYFIAILMILNQYGFAKSLNSLIAAAGIGSLAIGFGAQNLVKDVVTGFFMLFENQFSVGDYIKLDNEIGTVEATAMRVTYMRTFQGEQVIIPNGSINRVINYTRGHNLAKITVSTAYEADTRQVIEILEEAVADYAALNPDLVLEPPVVQGITEFGASSVDIGIICKTPSLMQWQVERGMRLAIKETFDRKGINFPYPHMVVSSYPLEKQNINHTAHTPIKQDVLPSWVDAEEMDED